MFEVEMQVSNQKSAIDGERGEYSNKELLRRLTVIHRLMLHRKLKCKLKFVASLSAHKNYMIILYNSIPSFISNFKEF